MKKKLEPDQLNRLAETLFGSTRVEQEEVSPDSVFLAGFRGKLDRERTTTESSLGIGEICWKSSPLIASICLVLMLFLGFASDAGTSEMSASEEVLWSTWTATEGTELSGDLIVEVVLVERGGE